MNFIRFFSLPVVRYKAWRLASRIFLGNTAGVSIGEALYRDLEEDWKREEVSFHIVARKNIADAYIEHYDFPDSYPPYFPRQFAFPPRVAYMLRDVAVSSSSGLIRIPGGRAFQQSIGSVPRFYRRGIIDMMKPVKFRDVNYAVVPFSPLSYFHLIFEAVPQVLIARMAFPESRVLLPSRHPGVMDQILELAGVPKDGRIFASGSFRFDQAVLVPRIAESGFVPSSDIMLLRNTFLPRLAPFENSTGLKVYISRSHSFNRPIANESVLESELEKIGFKIFHFEEMSFADQLSTVQKSSIIVAPHGAGLSNLFAAKPGTKVLEIIFPEWFNACYAKLSSQLQLDYKFIRVKKSVNRLEIPIDAVLSIIDRFYDGEMS